MTPATATSSARTYQHATPSLMNRQSVRKHFFINQTGPLSREPRARNIEDFQDATSGHLAVPETEESTPRSGVKGIEKVGTTSLFSPKTPVPSNAPIAPKTAVPVYLKRSRRSIKAQPHLVSTLR